MCGIYCTLSKVINTTEEYKSAMNCRHRGPDCTETYYSKDIFMAFHRLKINDVSNMGNQPMKIKNTVMICNGEIYNYKALCEEYKITLVSKSDCEVIPYLYRLVGFTEMIKLLDGVFALVLYDMETEILYAARDRIGVRSMYYGINSTHTTFASTLSCFNSIGADQFPPSNTWDSKTNTFKEYFTLPQQIVYEQERKVLIKIKELLTNAVDKRLMSDAPIGCLLSGGLDSSLVASLLSRKIPGLRTFSVGLKGSPDLIYAKMVSEFLGTIHFSLELSENQMLNGLERTVKMGETYDTTTIRAATPMLLLCEYIRDYTDIKVIYSGEGSDELFGSYLYFHNAPSADEHQKETIRLVKDLHRFDVQRCDKSTAACGLEVRVPFLDRYFIDYVLSINPVYKSTSYGNIEKWILRKAFDDERTLPFNVLWRKKEGMSDGVSSVENSWSLIIQEFVDTYYTDDDYNAYKSIYTYNIPMSKEALYYRIIYNNIFPNSEKLIPYYWLPKWSGNITDPSARYLTVY